MLQLLFLSKTYLKYLFVFICSMATITNDIMSLTVFSDLIICALNIAFNLLLLESTDHMDLQIATSFYNMSTVVLTTFIFCLLSENITHALSRIGDSFYNSMWYCLPVHHQKRFILALARSQRMFHLKGLGIIPCSLATFLRVNV